MIEVKKLMEFLQSPVAVSPLVETIPAMSRDEADEIREELEDDTSEAAECARKLQPAVAYMELAEPAGAFSCGTCKFAKELAGGEASDEEPIEGEETGSDSGFCIHAAVRAHVSAERGCCNYWHESESSGVDVVFPPREEE